jgi:hypothetical protein
MTNNKMPEVGARFKRKLDLKRIFVLVKIIPGKESATGCEEYDLRDESDLNYRALDRDYNYNEISLFEEFEEIPSKPKQQPTWPKETWEAMKKNLEAIKTAMEAGKYGLTHFERQIFLFCENLLSVLDQNLDKCTTQGTRQFTVFENKAYGSKDPIDYQPSEEEKEHLEKNLNKKLWGKSREKTSIWKDVSELPERATISIIWLKNGRKIIASFSDSRYYGGRWLVHNANARFGFDVFLTEDVEKHCDIADFFNQAESDHLAIAELRERLDKLEGKE